MNRSAAVKMIMIVLALAVVAGAVLSLTRVMGGAWADAGRYTAGDAEIGETVRKLDIDWTAGKVSIAMHGGNTVLIREETDAALRDDDRVQWLLDGDTLRIRYQKPGFRLFSFNNPEKRLTVTLPDKLVLDEVSIDATSGALNIPALQADTLSLSVTSGDIRASAGARIIRAGSTSGSVEVTALNAAESIDLSATSGNVTLTAAEAGKVRLSATSGAVRADAGKAEDLEAGTTSGVIRLDVKSAGRMEAGSTSGLIYVSAGAFKSLKIHATSGAVSAALPEKPGFTARLTTTSGRLSYELPLSRLGDAYTCGDGSAQVEIGTTSGLISLTARTE